jgi:hypothetical protein
VFKRIIGIESRGITRAQSKSHKRILALFSLEGLEYRRLMSGVRHALAVGGGHGPGGHGGPNPAGSSIAFSLTPTAVQSGLTALAATDDVTAPTSTTKVYLGNSDGEETYTVVITGSTTQLTVNQLGAVVPAPSQTTTTFGAITNTAVTAQLTAIASALSLTAPTSTTVVNVNTAPNGAVTYSVSLASTTSTMTHNTQITVDSNGNPAGNERVPLSVLSTKIQNALIGAAPTGATALTSTSLISVQTVDGVTLYSTTYTAAGIRDTVTVDATGTLNSPTTTQTTFGAITDAAVTDELQTLATADGVTTAIAATQAVTELTQANGTVLYTVQLTATSSTDTTVTYPITITVDAAGNPTVLPNGGPGGPGGGGPGGGGPGGGGPGGGGPGGGGPGGGGPGGGGPGGGGPGGGGFGGAGFGF